MNESPQPPVTPPQPPAEPPVHPTPPLPPVSQPYTPGVAGQPAAPVTPPAQSQTDVLGIIGIVLAVLGFTPVGLVLGLIGASKAKREGRSPLLSRIAWILSLVIMVLATLAIIFFLGLGILAASTNKTGDTTKHGDTDSSLTTTPTSSERKDYGDGFNIIVPDTFTDLPQAYRPASSSYAKYDSALDEYISITRDKASEFDSSFTLEEYANTLNKNYTTKWLQNATVTPLQTLNNPASYDVMDYEIRGSNDGIPAVYYMRYAKIGDSYYELMAWTKEESEFSAKYDLYTIVESFRTS